MKDNSSLQLFYCADLAVSPSLTLDDETAHHLVHVLRMKEGDMLLLTNGKGLHGVATIIIANKKQCIVQVEEVEQTPPPKKRVCVAVGILKNKSRWEWMLEKLTEIGVTHIVPLQTARTERQAFRADRWEAIVQSAMLQSKQYYQPELAPVQKFSDFIQSDNSTIKFIAHCLPDEPKTDLMPLKEVQDVSILIGPEGDFTPEEIEQALGRMYQPVSLGETRLRTETAAMVAATVLTR